MRTKILLFIFCIVVGLYFLNLNFPIQDSLQIAIKTLFPTEVSGVGSITTGNYANTTLEYYYYIPIKVKRNRNKEAPFLVMVPGLSGNGQDFVTQPFKDFAQAEGFVIIAPSFKEDAKNWESGTSYQFPAAWSGKALNKILNDFIDKQKIASNGLYMIGFSAGAQFTERYSLLYPNYVIAASVNSPGGITQPIVYQKTKFLITVGSADLDVRKEHAAEFYNDAKAFGIDVQSKRYSCGHNFMDGQINDSIAFFKGVAESK